jgi:hypothetical protein
LFASIVAFYRDPRSFYIWPACLIHKFTASPLMVRFPPIGKAILVLLLRTCFYVALTGFQKERTCFGWKAGFSHGYLFTPCIPVYSLHVYLLLAYLFTLSYPFTPHSLVEAVRSIIHSV